MIGSESELFIVYNKEDDIEEMIGEVNQTANDENEELVKIEIVKENIDNPNHGNCSIIFEESDDEDWRTQLKKDFYILKFEWKKVNWLKIFKRSMMLFFKVNKNLDLHRFYEIKYQRK